MLQSLYSPIFRIRALMQPSAFRGVTVDAHIQARQLRRQIPSVRYAIFFTPRSGSSRVTDILNAARSLGRPSEFFSPYALPDLARACNAPDLETYVAILQRTRRAKNSFGFEITYQQLVSVFGSDTAFHDAFGDLAMFWLIREDIVAQAVSSSRMVQTGLRHLSEPDPDKALAADAEFHYRPREIRERIRRLRWMEDRTEAYFSRYGIAPLRLSYERLSAMSPQQIVRLFSSHLGLEVPPDIDPNSSHARVSSDKSVAFAERFRADHARWMARVEAARQPLLDALSRETRCPTSP